MLSSRDILRMFALQDELSAITVNQNEIENRDVIVGYLSKRIKELEQNSK